MDHYDEFRESERAVAQKLHDRAWAARKRLEDVPLSRFSSKDLVWLMLMYQRYNTNYASWIHEAEQWIADNLDN